MKIRRTHVRRGPAPQFRAGHPAAATLRASWREGTALAAGFLVLLVTTWLIWAALAEAALALAETP